jgi:sugar lactone lactonase YvrE
MRVEALPGEPCRLGECPIWCERTRRLWWVDVLEPALWSHDPAAGVTTQHPVKARRIGSIALREAGGLLLACDDGLYAYDTETGAQTFLVDPEPGMPGHRKNDGRADPFGNFWVGTLEEAGFSPVGRIYRVAPDRSVSVQEQGMRIPNALAFDGPGRRMYYADTREYAIRTCTFDAEHSDIAEPRTFAVTTPPARPDGSCVDADGCLWNVHYAGRRVVRYAPSAEILASVDVPATYATCCCFGGRELDELYVTSGYGPLTEAERSREPLAGRTFVVKPGVRGRVEYRVGL